MASVTRWRRSSPSPVVPCCVATGVYTVIAEWGRHDGEHFVQALGFTHCSPCAATLHTVLRWVDREVFEARLGAWAEGLLGEAPAWGSRHKKPHSRAIGANPGA